MGKRRIEEVAIAKTFFQQHFSQSPAELPNVVIQRRLMTFLAESRDRNPAEYCLRCYISHQIEQVCLQLESQFGADHGFTRNDLFAFVLDDDGDWITSRKRPTQYRSLATEILETFDPDRAGLSTWVTRLVRHHKELNAFLLQQGVYLVSDWAILNDTSPKQLERIFTEFHAQTPVEIQQALHLLQSYHHIYRRDRLQQRQRGVKGQCPPPTPIQLEQMAAYLHPLVYPALTPEAILSRLQAIATQLRHYRVHIRGGALVSQSIDRPDTQIPALAMQTHDPDETEMEQQTFLMGYREQLLVGLDQVTAQVVGDRLALLQRKRSQAAQQFLKALHLFHCQGQSMTEIAAQVGLQAQFQVTRLMKLKQLRSDIRQRLLKQLKDYTLGLARTYTDTQLQTLDHAIEAALDEQLTQLMQQAEAEASVAKKRPLTSLFARRLCHHLDTRSLEP